MRDKLAIAAMALSLLGCSEDDFSTTLGPVGADAGETGGNGGSMSDGSGGGETTEACGECAAPTPACNDAEECVECTSDTHCGDATPLCDVSAEECVGCLGNVDCTDAAASVCDGGSCSACVEDADCSHVMGKLACDVDSSSCVECTDSGDCGGDPCNPVTHTCSAFGTDRLTCESCDTDENCAETDNLCVPMAYDGVDRGGYCLKTNGSGCEKPYFTPFTGRSSLSGLEGETYCGINEARVTCEAVRALDDGDACPGGEDAECPESGLCRDIGGVATNRCTFACADADDCIGSGAKSTCGTTGPDDFCGYVP